MDSNNQTLEKYIEGMQMEERKKLEELISYSALQNIDTAKILHD